MAFTVAEFIRTFVLISYTALAVLASMAPGDMSGGHAMNIKELRKIFRSRQPVKQATKSDAMELYSIAARKVLRVGEMADREGYDPKFMLDVTNSRGNKQNRFVTETVTFQSLRIKSLDNNMFLCVKNGNEIVFKVDRNLSKDGKSSTRMRLKSGLNRNKKIRKRCLFTWDFTHKMHIQLTVTPPNGRKVYLAVRNGVVQLLPELQSTEMERSFIWVPTKNGVEEAPKKERKRKNKHNKRHATSDLSRNFKDQSNGSSDSCSTLTRLVMKAKKKIYTLEKRLEKLSPK